MRHQRSSGVGTRAQERATGLLLQRAVLPARGRRRTPPPPAASQGEKRKTVSSRSSTLDSPSKAASSHSAGNSEHKTTSGRRTSASAEPTNGTSSSGRPAQPPPPHARNERPHPRLRDMSRRQLSRMSRMEAFMRTTPFFDRFVDGALLLGDMVMVTATELSSERVPWEQAPYLAAAAAFSWVLAAALLGDYRSVPDPDDNPLAQSLGWPVLVAIINACITWAAAMPPALLGYSLLVSHYLVDPEVVLVLGLGEGRHELSPQLEVSVALLVTMTCWRGMAARLRMGGDAE